MAVPADISAITHHWDASDLTSLTRVTDADHVSTIDDLKGSVDLTQATSSAREPAMVEGPNGLNAMDFLSNNRALSNATLVQTHPYEIWISVKENVTPALDSYLWDAGTVESLIKVATLGIRIDGGDGTDDTDLLYANVKIGSWRVIRHLFDGTNGVDSQVWADEVALFTTTPIAAIGDDAMASFSIGADLADSKSINGCIGECFTTNAVLSASEVTDMWAYMSRWSANRTQSSTGGGVGVAI